MTLNGAVARTVIIISQNSVAFEADYVKMAEDTPIDAFCSGNLAKEPSFSDISLTAISVEDHL